MAVLDAFDFHHSTRLRVYTITCITSVQGMASPEAFRLKPFREDWSEIDWLSASGDYRSNRKKDTAHARGVSI